MLDRQLKILYIEDDKPSARLMEQLLLSSGYKFRHAEMGTTVSFREFQKNNAPKNKFVNLRQKGNKYVFGIP